MNSPDQQGESGQTGWIKIPGRTFARFRRRWLTALTGKSDKADLEYQEYWQHSIALAEMRRRRYRSLVYLGPEEHVFPSNDVIDALWKEIQTYSRYLNEVTDINHRLRSAAETLVAAEQVFNRLGTGTLLRPILNQHRDVLTNARKRLLEQRSCFWTEALQRAGTNEQTFQGLKFTHAPSQERNLDSRFQIRVGAILRAAYPRLSLISVSRFVLLSYVCADLVQQANDNLIVLGSKPGRKLTVEAIYEKIRDAGLK